MQKWNSRPDITNDDCADFFCRSLRLHKIGSFVRATVTDGGFQTFDANANALTEAHNSRHSNGRYFWLHGSA